MRQPWLAEKARAGARKATKTLCRRCGAQTLTGLDNDICALQAVVDPDPVPADVELAARASGRWSYDLVGPDLFSRRVGHLSGPRRWPVLLDHLCEETA